jgi:hypothetical protein
MESLRRVSRMDSFDLLDRLPRSRPPPSPWVCNRGQESAHTAFKREAKIYKRN